MRARRRRTSARCPWASARACRSRRGRARTACVAVGPLEVVHQRPVEVAPHVRAAARWRRARRAGGRRRRRSAPGRGPGRRRDVVGVRRAVLGEVHRRDVVLVGQPGEQPGQALGLDLPAHVGDRQPAAREGDVLAADERRARRPLGVRAVGTGDLRVRSAGDGVALVVVDAERVERACAISAQVAVAHHVGPRPALPRQVAGVGEQVGGVGAAEHRVEEDPVVQRVDPARGVPVELVRRVVRVGDGEVERDARARWSAPRAAQLVDHEAVAEQQVVGGDQPGDALLPAGRVLAAGVAEERRAPRLVERRPDRDTVADGVVHGGGVLGEPVGRVPVGPAARVLERLRQVPVVERQPRRDAGVVQLVDEPAVEVEPALVDRAAVRAHPRPGDGEPVRRRGRARASARRPAASGGSGRRRRRRCRRPTTAPGTRQKVSQMDGVRPSSATAPSIWYDAVAAPQTKPAGKTEVGCGGAGPGRGPGGEVGHPLTAPCMMPATSWRPVRTKRTRSGSVASVVPARTRL